MIATEHKVETASFYVNGAWEQPGGRTRQAITNPATGELLAQVAYATGADVDRAVRAAHEAFLKWREVPVVDRVLSRSRSTSQSFENTASHWIYSNLSKVLKYPGVGCFAPDIDLASPKFPPKSKAL
jgi:delta 1-pyrroline-5-carboxylate dehydrogenase